MKYTVKSSLGAVILSNCKEIQPSYVRHFEKNGCVFEITLEPENLDEKRSTKNRALYFEILANEAVRSVTNKFTNYNHIVSTLSLQLLQKIEGYFGDLNWYKNNYTEAIANITNYCNSEREKTSRLIHYFNKIAIDLNSHVEGWDIIYLQNNYSPEFVDVSLRKAILSQYTPFAEGFVENNLRLHISDYFTDEARVSLDKKLFSLIMYNFFSNTLKYSMPNSEVRLTYDEPTKTLDISMYSARMNKNEIVSLFNDGVRGVCANDVSSSGNGAGLYVIKRALELMSLPNMYINPKYEKVRMQDSISYIENHFIFDFKKQH